MFRFWGNFGQHFGAKDLTLLKIFVQHFRATFSGKKIPPKSSAQKTPPKNATIFEQQIHPKIPTQTCWGVTPKYLRAAPTS